MKMYIFRRLLESVLVILLITIITFLITNLLPGDVARAMLGVEQLGDSEAYLALRTKLGLDEPVPVRYLKWLWKAAHGDFGVSYRTQELVTRQLLTRLPVTLELAFLAMCVAIFVGVPSGIISAVKPNGFLDSLTTLIATSGIAIPDFWLGIMLIYLFGLILGWLPPSGYVSPSENLGKNLQLMILPAITLGGAIAAIISRQTRSSLIEVMRNEYITAARAKGLNQRLTVLRHGLPNGLIPVLTVVGLQTGRILGGSVIVETIFGLPGIGRLAADTIFYRDLYSMQAIVLFMALAVLAMNLVTDILYAYVDPRIRLE